MYLHLGSDYMVKNSEIIAIFNLRDPQSDIYNAYVENIVINTELLICRKTVIFPAVF